ncbi:YdcF family protein [Gudongella sp. DL1XJH-153]|uniref:YdcF family protein n=1 Tax=Gudongella sp. DL1XJH-153 TaxID=3409804 RepID=UPI003BB6B8C6
MKNNYKRILILIASLFIISFVLIEGIILLEGREADAPQVDYVIVLGARLYGDVPSPALAERLKAAEDYLIENESTKVVVTGGQGTDETIPEAQAMRKYLVENGIDENRIIVEDRATSTYENMKYSKELIEEETDEPVTVLVITNEHHIFRAKFLAKRQGMEAYGLPAKIPPSILLQSYIREYFAVVKSLIFDH